MGGLTVQNQKGLSVCLKEYTVKPFCLLINNAGGAQNKWEVGNSQMGGVSHQSEVQITYITWIR